MASDVKKKLKSLIEQAESEKWKVTPGRSGHLSWKSPVCGHRVFSSATPSDPRALPNHLSLMKAHGWNPAKVCTR